MFSGEVYQVDLPGVEGDFGILVGQSRTDRLLRPGIVTAIVGYVGEKFVILGGLAEFSQTELTILANSGTLAEDFGSPD